MAVKQSTISIAAAGIFLVLAVLLGAGVYLVSGSIAQEQNAVGWQFDAQYEKDKQAIMASIAKFQEQMDARLEADVQAARASTSFAVTVLGIIAVVIPLGVGGILFLLHRMLGVPVAQYVAALRTRGERANDSFALAPQGT